MSGPGSVPLTALPFGVAILDAAGSILAANDAFVRLAGMEGLDLVGKSLSELTSSGQPEAEFVAAAFGSRRGDFRIRIRSFELGAERGALVVVEEASELRDLDPVASDHRLALETVARCRHGINNSLMAILGHLELLLSQADVPEAIRKRAEILFAESGRIKTWVAELDSLRRT